MMSRKIFIILDPPLSRIHATQQYCLPRFENLPAPLSSVTSFMDGL